jgi:hypothetical protein
MEHDTKLKIAAGAAAALAVAGGGAAVAATKMWSPKEESQAVITDAAKQLGVRPSELSNALKKALEDRVDAAVAAGRLTKEQGDALKARIESGDVPLIFPGFGPRFGHVGHFADLATAASYLGVTESELQSDLASGKTLADVAKAQGKSVDGLVGALVAAADKKIDAAVSAGRLTKAQADEIKADLKQRITDFVNGAGRPAPGYGFGPRFGRGFFEGPRSFGGGTPDGVLPAA